MVESKVNLEKYFLEPPEPVPHSGCGSCGSGSAAGGNRCGNGLEKIYPTTAVRFGYMRHIGEFKYPPEMKFSCGAKVIIQTRRGIEIGEQVSLTCNGCDKSVTRDQMKEWVDACGNDSLVFDAGRILREATAADLAEYARIQQSNRERQRTCQGIADKYRLPIRVVECESPFGGERIIFFFTAEERVDFRAIVKELTSEYHTRIEMRQIGARDEARLLADYETCGREVCCKVFLKTLRPITMRMAKLQKATLDPSQVSGRCGRLKCCLRYEHIGYEELDKRLPRNGVRILTSHGTGVVVNRQILTQLVQIEKEDGTRITVVAEDILEVGVEPGVKPPPPEGLTGPESDGADEAPSPKTEAPSGRERRRSGRRRRPSRKDHPRAGGGSSPPSGDGASGSGGAGAASGDDAVQHERKRSRRRRGRRRGGRGGGDNGRTNRPSSDT